MDLDKNAKMLNSIPRRSTRPRRVLSKSTVLQDDERKDDGAAMEADIAKSMLSLGKERRNAHAPERKANSSSENAASLASRKKSVRRRAGDTTPRRVAIRPKPAVSNGKQIKLSDNAICAMISHEESDVRGLLTKRESINLLLTGARDVELRRRPLLTARRVVLLETPAVERPGYQQKFWIARVVVEFQPSCRLISNPDFDSVYRHGLRRVDWKSLKFTAHEAHVWPIAKAFKLTNGVYVPCQTGPMNWVKLADGERNSIETTKRIQVLPSE